ncbi:MAG: hypothetical protein ACK559_17360, partial [bacterium]
MVLRRREEGVQRAEVRPAPRRQGGARRRLLHQGPQRPAAPQRIRAVGPAVRRPQHGQRLGAHPRHRPAAEDRRHQRRVVQHPHHHPLQRRRAHAAPRPSSGCPRSSAWMRAKTGSVSSTRLRSHSKT